MAWRWPELMLRWVAIALFGWRVLGVLLFEATASRELLLVFPNLFENFYLFVVIVRRFVPRFLPRTWPQLALVLVLLWIPKIVRSGCSTGSSSIRGSGSARRSSGSLAPMDRTAHATCPGRDPSSSWATALRGAPPRWRRTSRACGRAESMPGGRPAARRAERALPVFAALLEADGVPGRPGSQLRHRPRRTPFGGRVASLAAADACDADARPRPRPPLSYPLHRRAAATTGTPVRRTGAAHLPGDPALRLVGPVRDARVALAHSAERLPAAELVTYPRRGHTLAPVLEDVLDRVARSCWGSSRASAPDRTRSTQSTGQRLSLRAAGGTL
jgi:hypothetical protein